MADTSTEKHCAGCNCNALQSATEAGETRTARVEELLRQNHPLLDAELSAFRKIAEEARANLKDLDSRILLIRQMLENLLSARQRTQSLLEDTKSLLHPMRSIPNELLVQIFRCCQPEIPRDEDPDAVDPSGAPWLMAQVCHRWRELAVNTPQLWTRLFLDFDKHFEHITARQCAYKIGLFIQRSRGLLMDVYLGSTDSVEDHPVLPFLEVSIPQWRSLDVEIPRASLRSLSGNNFLKLRALMVRPNAVEDEELLNLDVFNPASAPVLRTLEVHQGCCWLHLQHVVLAWSRLTSVICFPAFDADALKILRTLANLEDLEVDAMILGARTPIRDVVHLPKLRRLAITEGDKAAGQSTEFFSALAIPALSELTLTYHFTSVLHFPTLPLPLGNLIKLDITCEMNSHGESTQRILDFLTLTHHVESLRLYDSRITVEFFDGLNLDDLTEGLPVRLPCLRFLDIGKCGSAPSLTNDLGRLFDMLDSRLPVEEGQRAEERVNFIACNGQSAATNETGTEFHPRCTSDDHPRCLQTVRFPRWLYVHARKERPEEFSELISRGDLECGVTRRDNDS